MKIRLLGATAILAALGAAGCATSPGYNSGYGNAPSSPYGRPYGNTASCYDCGTVTRIETVAQGQSVPNATGAVLGGIVGAVAAREIADDHTDSEGRQNTATVAGAVGGAFAGNAIQNRVQASSTYNVYVRMDDGRSTMVTQDYIGDIRQGSYVRIQNGTVVLR